MGLFRSPEILGIAGETLEFILRACEGSHPNEYMGFLRADDASRLGLDRDGQVITDVLVIPGTESGPTSASVKQIMQPNNIQSVGSVHSHPNGVLRPSDADLQTFGRGNIHIIVGAPYDWHDWQAFDSQGMQTDVDVLDVEISDEEFVELTEAAIETETETTESDETNSGFFSWFR